MGGEGCSLLQKELQERNITRHLRLPANIMATDSQTNIRCLHVDTCTCTHTYYMCTCSTTCVHVALHVQDTCKTTGKCTMYMITAIMMST